MLADRAVPSISTPQLALVEPDFDTCRPKRVTNPPRRVSILRGVAQEHRSRRCAARRFRRLLPHPRLLVLFGLRKNALRKPWQAIQILDCPLQLTAMVALGK